MTSEKTEFGRHLRRSKTIPERKLWRELRIINELGYHFRQHVPIGKYVADFAELSSRLIIEIDGDNHAMPQVAEHDAERTSWLDSEGFRVVRFGNRDVLQNLPGVIDAIRNALAVRFFPVSAIDTEVIHRGQSSIGGATPTPALPTRGREKEERSTTASQASRFQTTATPTPNPSPRHGRSPASQRRGGESARHLRLPE